MSVRASERDQIKQLAKAKTIFHAIVCGRVFSYSFDCCFTEQFSFVLMCFFSLNSVLIGIRSLNIFVVL